MIEFERYTLDNGLTVLLHPDPNTTMVAVNVLYDVGARDEHPDKTGFAHLFEHLMFGGSVHIPDFDEPLQRAGGESNAFTSNDITNYYDYLPAENIETALWLESDRMLSLAFTPKSLEVQRQVVIEEFKQRYLNQPYGDVWLHLRPLAYESHPYQWATIGKSLAHIEEATMEDVKTFFKKHYHPGNAILCVAGKYDPETIKSLIQKYFGDIPGQLKPARILPEEPQQEHFKELMIDRKVPAKAFYYAFKMPERKNPAYYVADVISDALGRDKSSVLYVRLKKELGLVSDINAYITGNIDQGLLVISGKLNNGVSFEEFESHLFEVLDNFCREIPTEEEMQKLINKINTSKEFKEQSVLSRAMNLSFFELLGDAEGINQELALYRAIEANHIHEFAPQILRKNNCSALKVNNV